MKFRKKPVVIEAVPVRDVIIASGEKTNTLPQWVVAAVIKGALSVNPNNIFIETAEGVMEGGIADMLIQGVQGELYPCKPDIFAKTYEVVA